MRNPGVEWGHAGLGREPGRVASLIFVACTVGAIAGAGAVFSLVAPTGKRNLFWRNSFGWISSRTRGCTFSSKGVYAVTLSSSVGDPDCLAGAASVARRGDRRIST